MVPLVVGNWKMHGTQSECVQLARAIVRRWAHGSERVQVALAPPFTALAAVRRAIGRSDLALAAQNCHWEEKGAFTGEVSPAMLRDIGCGFVILGHSERRQLFGESDAMVARKLKAALARDLRAILCVGETLAERRAGLTSRVISRQLRTALKGLVKSVIDKVEIAYEPVWAIGTGLNATPQQIGRVHKRIRQLLITLFGDSKGRQLRILYGGSVKPDNAGLLAGAPEVGGFLVGGASLNAEHFAPIVGSFSDQ